MKEAKTHVANVRVDLRAFATVYLFFLENGLSGIRFSKGKTISLAFKYFERLVVDKNPEMEFTTHTQAVKYLQEEGILDLNQRFRNREKLIRELQKENLLEDGIDPGILAKKSIEDSKRTLPKGIASHQQMEEINRALDENIVQTPKVIISETLEKANERRAKEDQKTKEEFLNITKGE